MCTINRHCHSVLQHFATKLHDKNGVRSDSDIGYEELNHIRRRSTICIGLAA